jgi:hypothetical protein
MSGFQFSVFSFRLSVVAGFAIIHITLAKDMVERKRLTALAATEN